VSVASGVGVGFGLASFLFFPSFPVLFLAPSLGADDEPVAWAKAGSEIAVSQTLATTTKVPSLRMIPFCISYLQIAAGTEQIFAAAGFIEIYAFMMPKPSV
jgi:hypothetical protein